MTPETSAPLPFPVVCLLASAGGLDALQTFFRQVPDGSGMAFLVLQHQPHDHVSLLPELLGAHAVLPVAAARTGETLQRDRIYVLTPDMTLLSEGAETLILERTPESVPNRMPGDALLAALAEQAGQRAVGIVLSGSGTDGTAGLRAIKMQGGLTLAQSPSEARYENMPRNAIEAGVVDFVMGAAELPVRLLEQTGSPVPSVPVSPAADAAAVLQEICGVLLRRTGHDFSRYKPGTLTRRIQRRMQVTRAATLPEYVQCLERSPGEVDLLLKDLLIGVTEFFRDPEAFEELAAGILPQLFQQVEPDAPVRFWVPGCASGEEAYSLAILVREWMLASDQERPVQIFATDIDTEALMQARSGRYLEDAVRNVSPERLARFFTREGETYRVTKELRDMCVFSVQNILRDPPFSSLHFISCRNVLIYLQTGIQRRLVPLFHFALKPGGFLFLGPSEGLASHPELFESQGKPNRLFRRREVAPRPVVEFPISDRRSRSQDGSGLAGDPAGLHPLPSTSDAFERMLLEEYAPASVIVNELGDILYCAGQAGRFLQPPLGVPTHNLLASTRGIVRRELRTLLAQAAREHRKVVRDDVRHENEQGVRKVRISVRPMPGLLHNSGILAVIFQEQAGTPASEGPEAAAALENPLLDQLDEELRATRAALQSTVEELESTNEELRSSNEELQSSNEELQTSQEELQSVNEELATVNTELKQKVRELNETNSDLQNLLASTEIATIFLSPQLRITKFTPAATALFGLIEGDLGRPIADLVPRFVGLNLSDEAEGVLASSHTVEHQVRSLDGGRWFMVRLLPYRTLERVVSGVVATFVDITGLKLAEQTLARSEAQTRAIFEQASVGFLLSDPEGRIQRVNRKTGEITGYAEEALLEMRLDDLIHPDDLEQTHRDRAQLLAGAIPHFSREKRYVRRDGGIARVEVTVTLVRTGVQDPIQFLTVVRDVTDQRRLEAALRMVSIALEKSPVSVVITDTSGLIEYVNPHYCQVTGYAAEEVMGQNPRLLKSGETRSEEYAELWRVITSGGIWQGLFHNRRKDGSLFWEQATIVPIRDDRDAISHYVALKQDITERKRSEEVVRESEARYRRLFENMVEGFAHCRMRFDGEVPADFLYLSVNEAFTTQTGLKDVTGRWVSEVIPGIREADPQIFEVYGRVARTGAPERFETFVKAMNMWFDIAVYRPAPDEFVAVFDVIDQRRRLEAERLELERRLLHAQKLESLGVLAGGIAHDFNNLLLAMLGNLDVALAHLDGNAPAVPFLEQAKRASWRATDLTRQMLDYSGRGAFSLQPVDLNALVEENAALFRASVPKTHAFRIDLPGDQPRVLGDAGQIQQVIMNLITNAAEAIPDQGTITLTTRTLRADAVLLESSRLPEKPEPGTFVCLEVTDTGVGMDGDVLQRLFDPFFTTKATGRGLGMAALQGIVRGHLGAIFVESQPGKGTCIRVLFPVVHGQVQDPDVPTPSPSEAHTGEGLVLVADDEAMILEANAAMLDILGYAVQAVGSGEEALRRFAEDPGRYCAALLDLSMPDRDGLATLAALRRIRPDLPVILSSGYAEQDVRTRIPQGDRLGFLQKPFDLTTLKATLGQVRAGVR